MGSLLMNVGREWTGRSDAERPWLANVSSGWVPKLTKRASARNPDVPSKNVDFALRASAAAVVVFAANVRF
jgi:hypothetical protein